MISVITSEGIVMRRDRRRRPTEETLAGVVVRLVGAHLLVPARDEHGPANHDERPQRLDLMQIERTDAVEGADRGQDRQG